MGYTRTVAAPALLSGYPWRCVITDNEMPAVHSAMVVFVDQEIRYGRFRFAAAGAGRDRHADPARDDRRHPDALSQVSTR